MKQSNSQIRDDATNLKEAIEYFDGRSTFTRKAEKKRKKLRALLSGLDAEERADIFSGSERVALRATAEWRTEEIDEGTVKLAGNQDKIVQLKERAERLEQGGMSYAAANLRDEIAELEEGQ